MEGNADLLEGHKDGIAMIMRFESGVAVVYPQTAVCHVCST
jgi:hypothetical protein